MSYSISDINSTVPTFVTAPVHNDSPSPRVPVTDTAPQPIGSYKICKEILDNLLQNLRPARTTFEADSKYNAWATLFIAAYRNYFRASVWW